MKIIRHVWWVVALVALLASGVMAPLPAAANLTDWCSTYEDWMYRVKITVDNYYVDEDLPNFPLLVCFHNYDFDYDHAEADGSDIRFVDEDGTTLLPREIEDWNPGGTSYVWVRANIEASGEDYIWMYYGYAGTDPIPDPLDSTLVWISGYEAVHHMVDATASTVLDSTANGNDGTKPYNNEPTEQPGKIYRGQDFDGSDDYIELANESHFDYQYDDAFTVEAWIFPDNITGSPQAVVSKLNGASPYEGWEFIIHDPTGGGDGLCLSLINDAFSKYISVYVPDVFSVATWYYVCATYDGSHSASGVSLYINGVPQTTTTWKDTLGTNSILNDKPVQFGMRDVTNLPLEGYMDEVRISATEHSAEWIEVSYRCMFWCGSFAALGAEEENFTCQFYDLNRDTTLMVNPDLGKFRFLGPGYDTGIVQADFMRVRDRGGNLYIDISHRSGGYVLWARAICGDLDFCSASLRDSGYGARYLLWDAWGQEGYLIIL